MSRKPPPRPSFLDDGENGARRKEVRYRLDGKGQELKKPLDIPPEHVPTPPVPSSTPPAPSAPHAPPNFLPILPKRRQAPVPDTTRLVKKITENERKYETELKKKEMEIHFLRCSLAKTNSQSLLDSVDSLMSKKEVAGWVPFENLKKVSEMSLDEVEGEIQIRGENHLILSWETKCK